MKLYFIGIGGTAMGAVACACRMAGIEVTGSDTKVYSPMKEFLDEQGIPYFDGFSEKNILAAEADMIVVGNAISRGNPELEAAMNARMEMIAMPELVRKFLIRKHTSVVITGTHGKTSTSSMTAWLLESAGRKPGFMIGGIPGNFSYGCRPVPENTEWSGETYFVSEGDEYDSAFFDKRSKFLHYRPDIAVINNIEFDHADIYDSLDDIKRSFRLFTRLVPSNGLLLINAGDRNIPDVLGDAKTNIQSFGFAENSYWRATNTGYSETSSVFTLLRNGECIGEFSIGLAGEHNVHNAIAVAAIGFHIGLSRDQIQEAFSSFRLPKRRLETIGEWRGCTVIDDFAHHPTAIELTLKALEQKFPGRRLIACFEPRSNTTTRNFFQKELVDCFESADIVCIGAVNRPERYAENERLDTEKVLEDLQAQGKLAMKVSNEEGRESDWGRIILRYLESNARPGDVIAVLSNGDMGGLRQMLVK